MRGRAWIVIVLLGALVFGAGIQYLASRPGVQWAVRASGLSAPWLLIPFLAGVSQVEPRRAGWLGLAATSAALLGYFGMTWSPFEAVDLGHVQRAMMIGGHLRVVDVALTPTQIAGRTVRLLGSQAPWLLGGIVTGPLFGLVGNEWRLRRTWRSALTIAGAFCFEPAVILGFHRVFSWIPMLGGFGTGYTLDAAAAGEVGFGVLLAAAAGWVIMRRGTPAPQAPAS